MAMYHHDARDYATAAADARELFRKNMLRGAEQAARGMRRLQDRVITDQLMPLNNAKFELGGLGANELMVNGLYLTAPAFGQLCQRAELRTDTMRKWLNHESQLVRNHALESFEVLSAVSDSKVMLRSVGTMVHGVVSDAFKRMDSQLIVGSFTEPMAEFKLMPVQCQISATRVYMRALMPRIYGEEFGEAIAYGIELKASDFGFGNVELNPFAERVWCTNKARMSLPLGKGFKKAHRGARITEENFQLSAATQELQMKAMASELTDGVRGLLSPESLDIYSKSIAACFREDPRKFDVKKELEELIAANKLTQTQGKLVDEAYNSGDRYVVPAQDGRWKLAQAIAYAAQRMDDVDVQVELEYLAGEVVDAAPKNALPAYAH